MKELFTKVGKLRGIHRGQRHPGLAEAGGSYYHFRPKEARKGVLIGTQQELWPWALFWKNTTAAKCYSPVAPSWQQGQNI